MSETLKPCPFCGETEQHLVGIATIQNYYCGNNSFIGYLPQCLNCGVTLLVYGSEEEAIKAWNTRANA